MAVKYYMNNVQNVWTVNKSCIKMYRITIEYISICMLDCNILIYIIMCTKTHSSKYFILGKLHVIIFLLLLLLF